MSRRAASTSCGGCTHRTVWTLACISVLLIGFTTHLLGVATPSWQYVYLEDGRTEHHHGLWLDCKRDYSNEYGRPREYYESLNKINRLQNPFDQFWLPKLQCVYKFDYWLDDEDWYEHGYDENRLQGDAYQHLFIGWKIAAFTAHAFALVCEAVAFIMLFCGFCHRLSICVATVLITLATIACAIGNAIFYMFASYQDNNIIREEDGIYEQHFGWSFYSSLIGIGVLFGASVLGCSATSAVLSSGHTRLVKIKILDENGAQLLRMKPTGGYTKNQKSSRYLDSAATSTTHAFYAGNYDGAGDFRRSRSAVYRIDSNALRQWERDTMNDIARSSMSVLDFKRANSLPNVAKQKQLRDGSSSQQSLAHGLFTTDLMAAGAVLPTSTTREFIPSREPPFRVTRTTSEVVGDSHDRIYEYVDERSLPPSSTAFQSAVGTMERGISNGWLRPVADSQPKVDATTLNTYDRVPLKSNDVDKDDYLKPLSAAASDISASTLPVKAATGDSSRPETTFAAVERRLLVDTEAVKQRRAFCGELQQRQQQLKRQQVQQTDKQNRRERNAGKDLKSALRLEPLTFTASTFGGKQESTPYPTPNVGREPAEDATPGYFQINTFQAYDSAQFNGGSGLNAGNSPKNNRSLVNLVNVASDQASTISVFDRRDSIDFSAELDAVLRSPQPLSIGSSAATEPKPCYFNERPPFDIKETNFSGSSVKTSRNPTPLSTLTLNNQAYSDRGDRSYAAESELDRSIGSTILYNHNNFPKSSSSSAVDTWKRQQSGQSNAYGLSNTSRTMI